MAGLKPGPPRRSENSTHGATNLRIINTEQWSRNQKGVRRANISTSSRTEGVATFEGHAQSAVNHRHNSTGIRCSGTWTGILAGTARPGLAGRAGPIGSAATAPTAPPGEDTAAGNQ